MEDRAESPLIDFTRRSFALIGRHNDESFFTILEPLIIVLAERVSNYGAKGSICVQMYPFGRVRQKDL